MKVSKDYDGKHVVEGFEEFRFSSREDAVQAIELAQLYEQQLVTQACSQESRYRRAAERGGGRVVEVSR